LRRFAPEVYGSGFRIKSGMTRFWGVSPGVDWASPGEIPRKLGFRFASTQPTALINDEVPFWKVQELERIRIGMDKGNRYAVPGIVDSWIGPQVQRH
jgi:hypothetical protein